MTHKLTLNGIKLAVAKANIRKKDKLDLSIIVLDEGCSVAGVFTKNAFCAPPVTLCKEFLATSQSIRALVINTGNANAGTGKDGKNRALQICQAVADELQVTREQVLPFSTGVIMETLPSDKIIGVIPSMLQQPNAEWLEVATAIMTTDTFPKIFYRQLQIAGELVTVVGIAKGAGMIHPNMATMLGFIATDARIGQACLDQWVKDLANQSFNCISVDGDTSTNDSFVLMATNKIDHPRVDSDESSTAHELYQALLGVAIDLAQAIVKDGEGATKLITIEINQGLSHAECKKIAFSIAHSPLVKTAFYASDPNLGRILAAIGKTDIEDLQVELIDVYLDQVWVVKNGQRNPDYHEAAAKQVMLQSAMTIRVDLKRGDCTGKVWTCDLGHEYVTINAEYRT
ncbi:MAG: bifunctional glutamate N-acetyltransferase/amino-acid acetyltransferase ArgJ [Gammaproteobacteria bacterium]|nr:bifunctional glutamate N-acetyltransferase/amino-acid acetyltransferase ArgJ [Gammaproteobacteria bacterium]